jgi:hypothetical protein
MPILKIKYKIHLFNLSLHNADCCHFIYFDFMRVATCDLVLALTLRGCDLEYFKPYDQFTLLISKSLYILIQLRLTLRDMWFFTASLIPWIEHPVALLHHIR